jgi:hypothetical protein
VGVRFLWGSPQKYGAKQRLYVLRPMIFLSLFAFLI